MRRLFLAAILLAAPACAEAQVRQVGPYGAVNPSEPAPILNHSDLKAMWRDLRAARSLEEAREPATRFGRFPWRFRGAVQLPGSDSYTDVAVSILSVRRSVEGTILGDDAILVDWEIQEPVGLGGKRLTVIRPVR